MSVLYEATSCGDVSVCFFYVRKKYMHSLFVCASSRNRKWYNTSFFFFLFFFSFFLCVCVCVCVMQVWFISFLVVFFFSN